MSARPVVVGTPSYAIPRKPLRVFSRQLPPTLRSSRHRADDLRLNQGARPATSKRGRRTASAWTICPQSDSTNDLTSDDTHSASTKQQTAGLFVFSVNNEKSLEMKEAIEKCMKWVEGLPSKFSGLNDLLPPVNYDIEDSSRN